MTRNDKLALIREALDTAKRKLETGPTSDSPVMTAWDNARVLINDGNDSDLPRILFEEAIDDAIEDIDKALALIPSLMEPVSLEKCAKALSDWSMGGDYAMQQAKAVLDAAGVDHD